MIELRDYQVDAVNAVANAWLNGVQRPAVVLPTGTGKSYTMAALALKMIREEGWRVIFLAHREELLKQLRKSVQTLDPDMEVGMVKANIREYEPDVVVASVNTLASTVDHITPLGQRDLILVDEAHHYAADTYIKTIEKLGGFTDTGSMVAGFTATMFRKDGGLDDIWEEVVFERDIEWAIENGFLVTPRGQVVVDEDIDLSDITIRGGDYAQDELEEMMIASIGTTVKAVQDYAPARSSIIFAAGVDHCYQMAEMLTQNDIPAAAVTGSTPSEEREDIFTRFLAGELQVLVTVQVLTEGTDLPKCDCIIIARPTKSPNLYSQMVGRALRLSEGKEDALVIDLVGSSRDMNLMSLTKLSPKIEVQDPRPEDDVIEESTGTKEKKQRLGIVTRMEEFNVITGEQKEMYRWLETEQGVEFITDGERITFLWNENDKYWVGVIAMRSKPVPSWAGQPQDYSAAKRTAERIADNQKSGKRFKLFRKKTHFTSATPSESQVNYARVLGIENADTMTKHRINDEIDCELVSRKFR